MEALMSSGERKQRIIANIIEDFSLKPRLNSDRGTALLVAASIYDACHYFRLFQNTPFGPFCGLIPGSPAEATSKQYVDHAITAAINALNLQNMATQRSNAVQITGGVAIFDRLRSRANPEQPYDAITLKYYNDTKLRIRQALNPMSVGPDNRTVTTPFKTIPGGMVLFVDQLYQIPDQYEITGDNTVRFFQELPANSVVSGFCISKDND
jgi:hypothetical protein